MEAAARRRGCPHLHCRTRSTTRSWSSKTTPMRTRTSGRHPPSQPSRGAAAWAAATTASAQSRAACRPARAMLALRSSAQAVCSAPRSQARRAARCVHACVRSCVRAALSGVALGRAGAPARATASHRVRHELLALTGRRRASRGSACVAAQRVGERKTSRNGSRELGCPPSIAMLEFPINVYPFYAGIPCQNFLWFSSSGFNSTGFRSFCGASLASGTECSAHGGGC